MNFLLQILFLLFTWFYSLVMAIPVFFKTVFPKAENAIKKYVVKNSIWNFPINWAQKLKP
jgi:hypothetical protein